MPATEQTWRDQKKLHFLFAISSTVLFIATVWMFLKDHNRQWKVYQDQARQVQITADEWRKEHAETAETQQEHEALQLELLAAQASPVPAPLFTSFVNELERYAQESEQVADGAVIDSLNKKQARLDEAAKKASDARAEADALKAVSDQKEQQANEAAIKTAEARQKRRAGGADAPSDAELKALEQAEQQARQAASDAYAETKAASDKALNLEREAGKARADLVAALRAHVAAAKFREDTLLGKRKFRMADLDKAKADEGLAVRDGKPTGEIEQLIANINRDVEQLTLEYQAASEHRRTLQGVVRDITAKEDDIAKRIEANRAELVRLEKAVDDRRSTYVTWWGPGSMLPAPGKKILEAPILDAFNSPLKIENLWSEGLTIDYNFRDVKRYDRCTTCHQMMEKSQPGQADKPAFLKERFVTLVLSPPSPEVYADLKQRADEAGRPLTVEEVYGIAVTDGGLLERSAVSVSHVAMGSLATQARLAYDADATQPMTGDKIRQSFLMTATADKPIYEDTDPTNPFALTPGLTVGDIFVEIDDSVIRSAGEVRRLLLDGAKQQKPLFLRVRRGLPSPFTSHPRLDLYVGSLSPHKMQEFACTICHEGQGSATEFKWASHTPNTVDQMKQWQRDYGWFDNHHWIFPMNAQRFAESSCLKCHHEVVELDSSPRFRETPAPKVVHGYNLIRKYGCYGCHEINGFDGPDKRIGPDLRLEPNFFAAAQQLQADPNYDQLSREEKDWIETVVAHPERAPERRRIVEMLSADAESDAPRLSAESHKLAPLFRDVEAPGSLRKPGPSLRYAATKLDEQFLFDWINNPRNFRPSTRMPVVFGLHDHLQPHGDEESEGLHIAQKYEPLEIQGIATYLQKASQKFDYLEPPSEVTAEPSAERGKLQFQTRGCIACHSHSDFADAEQYRDPHEIVQGPDLSRLAQKFDPQRNPDGRKWLYSWIKEPTRYHARTVMPDLFLDPIEVTTPEGETLLTDPVADIVEYLLSGGEREGWKPVEPALAQVDEKEAQALDQLMFEYLKDAFAVRTAARYAGVKVDEEGKPIAGESQASGIPADRGADIQGAERDLILSEGQSTLTQEQKLTYIGRKSIAKYGCYGCHDIPGFEDAKPIGAGLNDWGRKEPAKLAFEHIVQYLEGKLHGHGHSHGHKHASGGNGDGDEAAEPSSAHAAHGHGPGKHPEDAEYPDYMLEQVFHGNRIGFLYQKLREPRSYDYHKTENKKYNDRLRMPQFPFNDEDREAVMTFILGLIADPPSDKYVYTPDARQQAILEGEKILEKYNCQGCHILEAEKWTLSIPPEHFGEQMSEEDRRKVYPFLLPHVSPAEREASAKTDRRGHHTATLSVMPRLEQDGLPSVTDAELEPVDPEYEYDPTKTTVYFDLWEPAVIGGESFMVGIKTMNAPVSMVQERFKPKGGFLTRYLLPTVTQIDAAESGAMKGQEAFGWLPPPLIGEGHKVQTDWLHEFLLEPYMIRPAVFMRMPKFNLSAEEATKLATYFAARDNAEYPYVMAQQRQTSFLDRVESEYARRLERQGLEPSTRFDDAMRIVTSNDYCVKCHIVGDFAPKSSPRAMGPDLARVYRRFRPQYLREWIANPKSKLPYTAMPVNIPYDPDAEHLGGVSQDLYHGTSIEQVDALVDLLMNFDQYAQRNTRIADLVPPPPGADAPAEAATSAAADGSTALQE